MKVDTHRPLGYRMKRSGRNWEAWLRRPGSPRPLFYAGRTRHEAIAALLNGVVKMALETPERLFGSTAPHQTAQSQAQRAAQLAALNTGRGN